jgi:hypothetical protein
MFTMLRPHLIRSLAALALGGAAAIPGLTAAAAGDPSFTCADAAGGSSSAAANYDRLVIDFGSSSAVPQFEIHRQASSTFVRDASGQNVRLEGSAGFRLVLRNAGVAAGVPNDLRPRLPEIREVTNIGNFERVVSYGTGLSDQACLRAFVLSGPSRLVIDVQTAPDATAPAATSQPASTTPSLAPSSTAPDSLADTGHPAPAAQPSGIPFALPLVGLLLLIGGLATVGLRQFGRR